jgi:hypothetical protein
MDEGSSQLTENEEFIDVLHELLRKIAAKQGVTVTERNIYRPLRPLAFSQRKGRWFPKPGSKFPISVMPQDVFDDVRAKLAGARGSDGSPCLSLEDLNRLDEAWARYQERWARGTARSAENVPWAFWKLTAGANFSTVEGLYQLLREKMYLPMLRGDHKASKLAIKAILAGFENDEPGFATKWEDRLIQRDLILRDSAFCLYRMSDPAEHAYAQRMRRLLKDDGDRPLLMDGVLTHEYFANPSVEVAEGQAEFWLSNSEADWNWGPQAGLVRLTRPAFSEGYRPDDKPDFLGGCSLKDLIDETCDELEKQGWVFVADICRSNLLDAYAFEGDLERVSEGLVEFYARAHAREFIPPHLETSLLLVEAQANFSASKGKRGKELWEAGRKIREIAMLRQRLPRQVLRKDAVRLIEEIRRATIAEFGGDAHMRA